MGKAKIFQTPNNFFIEKEYMPKELVFFLSTRCNLNCSYCFVASKSSTPPLLEEKYYYKAVDKLFFYPGKNKLISFLGGEPLLEFDLLKKICDYSALKAKKEKIQLTISVSTNGVLLNQDKINYFLKLQNKVNDIYLRISIDGNQKTHDLSRTFPKDGVDKSSFDIIMKNVYNINRTQKIKLDLRAHLVYMPATINDFLENIKFLWEKGFSNINFAPEVFVDWSSRDLANIENQFKKFSDFYINLFRQNRSDIFKVGSIESIYGTDIMMQSDNSLKISCARIVFGPADKYYVCDGVLALEPGERREYIIGDAKSGLNDKKRIEILKKIKKFYMDASMSKQEPCYFCPVGCYFPLRSAKNKIRDAYRYFKITNDIFNISSKYAHIIINKLKYNPRFLGLYKI